MSMLHASLLYESLLDPNIPLFIWDYGADNFRERRRDNTRIVRMECFYHSLEQISTSPLAVMAFIAIVIMDAKLNVF